MWVFLEDGSVNLSEHLKLCKIFFKKGGVAMRWGGARVTVAAGNILQEIFVSVSRYIYIEASR